MSHLSIIIPSNLLHLNLLAIQSKMNSPDLTVLQSYHLHPIRPHPYPIHLTAALSLIYPDAAYRLHPSTSTAWPTLPHPTSLHRSRSRQSSKLASIVLPTSSAASIFDNLTIGYNTLISTTAPLTTDACCHHPTRGQLPLLPRRLNRPHHRPMNAT